MSECSTVDQVTGVLSQDSRGNPNFQVKAGNDRLVIDVYPNNQGQRWVFKHDGVPFSFPMGVEFFRMNTGKIVFNLKDDNVVTNNEPNGQNIRKVRFCGIVPIVVDTFNDSCSFEVDFKELDDQTVTLTINLLEDIPLWKSGDFSFQLRTVLEYDQIAPENGQPQTAQQDVTQALSGFDYTFLYSQDPRLGVGGTQGGGGGN